MVNLLENHFQNNLHAILQYGSSTTSTHPADVDIMVVLKRKQHVSDDLLFLKKTIRLLSDTYWDMQLIYTNEMINDNNFSLDSHGCFFVLVLKEAKVLWGENPFLGITPDEREIIKSVVRKLQYYVFRARQMFLGEIYRSKDRNLLFHRKKLLMAMVSIMLCNNPKPSKNVLDDFTKLYPEYLKDSEKSMLCVQEKEIPIENALTIYEKLYDLALSIEKLHGRPL